LARRASKICRQTKDIINCNIFAILQMIFQDIRIMTGTIIGSIGIIPWVKILKMKDITCNED